MPDSSTSRMTMLTHSELHEHRTLSQQGIFIAASSPMRPSSRNVQPRVDHAQGANPGSGALYPRHCAPPREIGGNDEPAFRPWSMASLPALFIASI